MSLGLIVQDDVVSSETVYRSRALDLSFLSYHIAGETFHGICEAPFPDLFKSWLSGQGLEPALSFFRQSGAGQQEPHYIHHDAMMGDWTAILYLNPEPHPGDEHRSQRAPRRVAGVASDLPPHAAAIRPLRRVVQQRRA